MSYARVLIVIFVCFCYFKSMDGYCCGRSYPIYTCGCNIFSCHCGKESVDGYCTTFEEGSCYWTDWNYLCCRFGYKKWSVRSHDSQMKVLFCITVNYLALLYNCFNESGKKLKSGKIYISMKPELSLKCFRWMTETLRQMILLKYFLTLM